MIGDGTSTFDARLDIVPTDPGVYLMKDASDSVIYVGKAKNLRGRPCSGISTYLVNLP